MSFSHGNLVALNRRLQSIIQTPTDQDQPIKLEEPETEPTEPRYICAECAWTTSTNAATLARHFTIKHTSRLKCPDCKCLCGNQEDFEKHRLQKHRHLCLGCHGFFPSVNTCRNHEPCEKQHSIAPTPEHGASSPTIIDQPVDGKAPASGQSMLNKRGSVQSGSCPDPRCELTFLDFDTLYEHYVGLHTLCIVYRGHPKPFKCPFCSKRYQHDRFLPGHVRTHKPKSPNSPGIGEAEDQEALIRQSHVAMANKESQLRAEAQAQAGRISSEEEEDYSISIRERDEYSLFFQDGVIYIDEGTPPENPTPDQSDHIEVQEPQLFRETTPIGLVLQAWPADLPSSHPTNETPSVRTTSWTPTAEPGLSDSMDLDDDYPERFALDDNEYPLRRSHLGSTIIAAQLVDGIFHQTLSREIIRALHMQHFVNVSEVVDLFTYFLDEQQRISVLEQLASIDVNQHDTSVLEALHGTVFKALIDAWVDFKRLAIRFAPQLII